MIVKYGILIKLYLIDYGYFHLDALKYKSGPLRKSLDEHMYRLRALLKKMI